MEPKREDRRLTTILATDVVGYSRLMAADESGTLALLNAHRREVIEPKTTEHHGRVVKLMGDGTLMEFGSVVDAINFAVDVQKAMVERNADLPDACQIVYRIGINIGDIIVEGDDIFGDGVNVAARLEGLADPGGICIARNVFNQIKSKVEISFQDMGEQKLKNIPESVRAYRIVMRDQDAGPAAVDTAEPLPLPDKPSIAVLPFVNNSDDPEQEYFADGIAEDVITALSRFRWFFVIARNSSFSYKGQFVEAEQVAEELGVHYVLEGSVRKSGNRVRITAQLIDAQSGHHVWAERYDRNLDDVFAVQDEITEAITGAVAPSFISAEAQRAERKTPANFDAWDCVMRAHWHIARLNNHDYGKARELLRRAIELDPTTAIAYSDLAYSQLGTAIWSSGDTRDRLLSETAETARKAVAIDDGDAWAHTVLGVVYRHLNQHEDSVRRVKQAIDLNPNLAHAHYALGAALAFAGDGDPALARIAEAIRLSPRDPLIAVWYAGAAIAAFGLERYDDAIEWAERSIQEKPEYAEGYRILAATLGLLGRLQEAEVARDALQRLRPGLTIETICTQVPWQKPKDMVRYLDGLRKSGIPE